VKIDVRGLFIAVILKHLLLLLALQLALIRSLLFLLLHLLNLAIDLRDLSLESHEQATPSSVLVGGGGDARISELLEEGCSLVLLLVQCQLPIPHI
jgi:hypothetical protein